MDAENISSGGGSPAGSGESPAEASKGIVTEDLQEGSGAEAGPGKKLYVLYSGTLSDGTVFDARRERNAPFIFECGASMVIDGLDEGVRGMKAGGKRRITIPPHLGYGSRAVGGLIPANSTLIFEIELLKVD